MAEEKETKEKQEKEAPPKKSLLKWIILGSLVAVLAAGGFFGWRMFFNKGDQEAVAASKAVAKADTVKTKDEVKIICPLESFVVNLMDKSGLGKRYLKTTIELEVDNEIAKEKVTRYQAQIRDTILLLLTSQSFSEISTIEGKLDLKQALLTRINQTTGEGIVRRIYFTEFVVQ